MAIDTQTLVTYINNSGGAPVTMRCGDSEYRIDSLMVESTTPDPTGNSDRPSIKLVLVADKEPVDE